MPDLEQLTANSKVSPGWILLGHADDQSAALGCDGWSAPAWTATVGCPFPTHQCTVPAEHRLWPDKQSRPSRPREPGAQSRHDHSITWRPAHALDLPLKYLHLASERQHLRLELGLIAVTGGKHIEQQANQRIDHGSHHAGAKA